MRIPRTSLVIDRIVDCARCGRNHQKLVFDRLHRPSGKMTHWACCPRTRQPILLKVVKTKDSTSRTNRRSDNGS